MRRFIIHMLFLPTLAYNLLLHRLRPARRWWDVVEDHVILGALPLPRFVAALAEQGVRAVVNTCEEYAGPQALYDRYGIEQLRIPTTDFTPPRLEDLERAVAFMRAHVERGHTVYVHCKAGRGRSATVVLCWLIAMRGDTPEQGQARLEAVRPHVNRGLWQRAVVQDFARRRRGGAGE